MNPEQLEKMQAQFQQISKDLASGDRAKVKAAQTQLQALGYDLGEKGADGGLGKDTSAAVNAFKKDINDAAERGVRDSEARGRAAENDSTNQLTKMATEFGPWAGGMTAGIGTGLYAGHKANVEDAGQKEAGSRLAKAMDIKPEASQNALKRLDSRRMTRGAKQFMGPAALFGGGAFTSEVVAPRFEDMPETQKWINLAATTENAAGAGMGVHALADLGMRKDPIDPLDRARIESRSMPTPAQVSPAVQQAIASPKAKAQTANQAPQRHALRLAGAVEAADGRPTKSKSANYNALKKGLSDANAAKVAEALNLPAGADRKAILQRARELLNTRGVSSIIAPLAAAGLAYDSVMGDAEAAGPREVEAGTGNVSRAEPSLSDHLEATGAATAAGATTAGGIKLAELLGRAAPTTMRALGGGMAATLPMAIGDQFDDYTPEELTAGSNKLHNSQARFQEATGLPDWLMGQNVAEAREMATVPEKSPARVYGNAYQPGSQNGMPQKLVQRLERMQRQGANDAQMANWLNKISP